MITTTPIKVNAPERIQPITQYSMFYSSPLSDGSRLAILYAPATTETGEFRILYTMSRCAPQDQFSRRTAREKCLNKLQSINWTNTILSDDIPNLIDALDFNYNPNNSLSEFIPSPLHERYGRGTKNSCGLPFDLSLSDHDEDRLYRALTFLVNTFSNQEVSVTQ